jgi:hypothetical protein
MLPVALLGIFWVFDSEDHISAGALVALFVLPMVGQLTTRFQARYILASCCIVLAQFVKVYGSKGPAMTWAQRAKAGVPTGRFQAVLAEKSRA